MTAVVHCGGMLAEAFGLPRTQDEDMTQPLTFPNMPKVYVTQKPGTKVHHGRAMPQLDLSPAEAYGELVFLLNRADIEQGTERDVLWKLREGLKDFNPKRDYILPIGHTIAIALAPMIAMEYCDFASTVRLLQWDGRLRTYEIFNLDLHAQP